MRLQKMMAVALLGSLASTSAFAQNNNTGEIVIQGVVPGVWELSVFDINSGYDFDLRDPAGAWGGNFGDETNAMRRVGTIHIASNLGYLGTMPGATLTIESANAGRMVNDQSVNGVAGLAQDYRLSLSINDMGTQVDAVGNVAAPTATAVLEDGTTAVAGGNYTFAADGSEYLNMLNPVQMRFDAGTAGDEFLLDVNITLGDPTGAVDNRPSAAGVYSDVLTFTIMDDDGAFGA